MKDDEGIENTKIEKGVTVSDGFTDANQSIRGGINSPSLNLMGTIEMKHE